MFEVDVVIVTFNRLMMLKDLLCSIESQSILPNKVIIYDDISTDGTARFLGSYTGKLNLCILLGESKSKNVAVSRNKCLNLVDSRYVIIMDDDDLMPPDKIEKVIESFKLSRSQMLSGDMVTFNEKLMCENFSQPILSDKPCKLNKSLFYGLNPLKWPTISFETSALKEVGGFDERFTMITDWTVYLRIMEKFECWYYPIISGYYRVHSNNMSTNLPALISDLEIFTNDSLGKKYGVSSYLMISKYIYYASQVSIFKALAVIWNYKYTDISYKRKIKLTLIALSGCYKYLSSLRSGKWRKLGSKDPRILKILLRV